MLCNSSKEKRDLLLDRRVVVVLLVVDMVVEMVDFSCFS